MVQFSFNADDQTIDFGENGFMPETIAPLARKHGLDALGAEAIFDPNAPQPVVTGFKLNATQMDESAMEGVQAFMREAEGVVRRAKDVAYGDGVGFSRNPAG